MWLWSWFLVTVRLTHHHATIMWVDDVTLKLSSTDTSACYLHLVTLKLSSTCTSQLKKGWHTRSLTRRTHDSINHYVSSNDTSACYHFPASLTDTSRNAIIILWLWSLARKAHWHAIIIWVGWYDSEVEHIHHHYTVKHGLHPRSLTRWLAYTLFNTVAGMHAL